jgi:hypothetical protein
MNNPGMQPNADELIMMVSGGGSICHNEFGLDKHVLNHLTI